MKAEMQRSKTKRNPARAGVIFPHMASDYPIKPFVIRPSGQSVTTVCLRQEDGLFLAAIAERPKLRYLGTTQKAAQDGVLGLYIAATRNPPDEAELERLADEEDLMVSEHRLEEEAGSITLEDLKLKYGFAVAGDPTGRRRKRV